MNYFKYLKTGANTIDAEKIALMINALITARKNGDNVFLIGNGGSAATAEHMALDLQKSCSIPAQPLSSAPAITAYANDLSYGDIFTEQLKRLSKPNDILMCISTSGNSPNVTRAARYARGAGLKVITLTAFDGGQLKKMVKCINLHVDTSIIEIAEDLHHAIIHSAIKEIKERDQHGNR